MNDAEGEMNKRVAIVFTDVWLAYSPTTLGIYDSLKKHGVVVAFHWAMRAGPVANVVHVPNTWAGWRIRSGQATDLAAMSSMAHRQKIEAIIDDAINVSAPELPRKVRRLLRGRRRRYCWERWKLQF
jgi:hypothetical protein